MNHYQNFKAQLATLEEYIQLQGYTANRLYYDSGNVRINVSKGGQILGFIWLDGDAVRLRKNERK